MSERITKTVQTAYGDVEVELVTCDSCGSEVKSEEAKRFVVGDPEQHNDVAISFHPGRSHVGWACEYCRDNGPVEIPEGVGPFPERWPFGARFLAFMIFGWLLIPLSFITGLGGGRMSDFDEGVLLTTMYIAVLFVFLLLHPTAAIL